MLRAMKVGDQDFTVGTSGNILMSNENTVY